MAIQPGKTMARRKRSEHYVNNKEFLVALIAYREDVEIIMVYQSFVRDSAADKSNQAAMSRKMGYLGKVDDTKEILEKIFKNSNTKSSPDQP